MRRLLAIAVLTWKSAFRFRLFWVLLVLLLGTVVLLPLAIKDDGTARGFTQILLTYTLSLITALLGLSTLWLACGTLARDIEDCQMQMVAVKPIARWQIWLGKWLGILFLNTVLLAVAGTSVCVLLQWRAQRLPPDQQRILHNEIFVARSSLREPMPNIENMVEKVFQERIKKTPVPVEQQPALRAQLAEQIRGGMQVVPPGYQRVWKLDLGFRQYLLKDQPMFVRTKFYAAQTNATGTYLGLWRVGAPESPSSVTRSVKLAANSFTEFEIPPNMIDKDGKLIISYSNQDTTAVLFMLEDGFEVLYREGGFALNFTRGMLVILCWLSLLAALGLASASCLSFPVAAFFSASLLLVALCSGTLSTVVDEGTVIPINHETGKVITTWLDTVLLPFFKGILGVVNLVKAFSPVEALSTGRSITWGQLGQAFAQVVLLMGGLITLAGVALFNRRELATAQSHLG